MLRSLGMILICLARIFAIFLPIINGIQLTKSTNVDIHQYTSSPRVYETDILLLDNLYRDEESTQYRFEDFFWTGNEDKEDESKTTIYKTSTVVSTVYIETTTPTETTNKCFTCTIPGNTDEPTITTSQVTTFTGIDNNNSNQNNDAGTHFWILTVLKITDGKDPILIDLKNSLAKLYKIAFERQQARHLGLTAANTYKKRKKRHNNLESDVKVFIHNLEKKVNGEERVQVIYHVTVSGKPIQAITASEDMNLVTDEEVRKVLGYPFEIKAEPFIKQNVVAQSLSRSKKTWIFIGISISALLCVLLVIALLSFSKKRSHSSLQSVINHQQVFERGVEAVENQDGNKSPTYINFQLKNSQSNCKRSSSSISSIASFSPKNKIMPVKKGRDLRPKAALKKIAPELYDSDCSTTSLAESGTSNSAGAKVDENIVSPKSYLSMPSVKSFPRGVLTESLNKVLEPVSVQHLDYEEYDKEVDNLDGKEVVYNFQRQNSVLTDPGVIGPVVWQMHQKKLRDSNVTGMRKRLHDLLDDTFTLFGTSTKNTPIPPRKQMNPVIEVKSHSAVLYKKETAKQINLQRPKTSTTTRQRSGITIQQQKQSPRGAWISGTPSPVVRPMSAPRINVHHVLADGQFPIRGRDPAIPLIAAIKNEIEKCSLPGSKIDLRS